MNELHLFAGGGGGILAGILLGHTTVCAVEYEKSRVKALIQRQRDGMLPKFPIWNDIRSFNPKPWRGRFEILAGGFPCQRFSTAASGKNTAEDLWPEMLRVARDGHAPFVFAENVSPRAIEIASEDLRSVGYKTRALELSASDLGADHIRKRYWLLAYTDLYGELLLSLHAKMAKLPSLSSGIWRCPPGESRMADGLAGRMERLKSTGNGQVPIVAATAFRILINDLFQSAHGKPVQPFTQTADDKTASSLPNNEKPHSQNNQEWGIIA